MPSVLPALLFAFFSLLNASGSGDILYRYKEVALAGWNYDLEGTSATDSCLGTYESACGPAYWAKVTVPPKDNQCNGQLQSPINLIPRDITESSDLKFPELRTAGDGCKIWTQFADDHAFEVSFSEPGATCTDNTVTFAGKTYQLLQFHFHSPSEHTIDGQYAEAEYHMVHKEIGGTAVLVLGILVNTGSIHGADFTAHFWDAAVASAGRPASAEVYAGEYVVEAEQAVRPYDEFLPASKNFFTYTGSLTTYPCTEGVTWIVFEEAVTVAPEDVQNLRDAVAAFPGTIINQEGNNNRPLQPLNGRVVKKYIDSIIIPSNGSDFLIPFPHVMFYFITTALGSPICF